MVATVRNHTAPPPRRGRGRPLNRDEFDVTDGTGGRLKITFFNTWGIDQKLPVGAEAVFFGKVDTFNGRPQMTNPVVDVIGGEQTGKIISIYPQHQVSSGRARRRRPSSSPTTSPSGSAWPSARPGPGTGRAAAGAVRTRLGLDRAGSRRSGATTSPRPGRTSPPPASASCSTSCCGCSSRSCCRKRALERTAKGIRHDGSRRAGPRFHDALPYPLTGAQQRVIGEITGDLTGPHPMHRLLQGDVGSGKTVVAVSALLVAVQGGHQGALMAHRGARRAALLRHQGAARATSRSPGMPMPDSLFAGHIRYARCGSSCSPTRSRLPTAASSPTG